MRKIFGGAMLFSGLGAAILGGALAWNASETTGLETIDVASIEFDMTYIQSPEAILGPNDGVHYPVGRIWLENDGEMNIKFHSSAVEIVSYTKSNGAPDDQAACAVTNFGGSTTATQALNTQPILEPGNDAEPADDPPHLTVNMAVAAGAPDACQGGEVTYRVVVTMQTSAPVPTP
jgi:hypothetical protein